MPQIFKVDKNYHNSRFDKWFKSNVAKIPQSLIQKLIRKNKIKVNKKKTLTSYRVQSGDLIEIYQKSEFKINDIKKNKYLPSKKEASKYDDFIIENNENFVVLNKPSGIAVQGGTKSFKNIIDIIKKSQAFENCIPYIVHRIDKDTSGLLLIAKNRKYAQLLTSLFRIRRIHKTYLAITHGVFPNKIDKLVDNLLIFEKNKKIIQKAITKVKVLKTHKNYSLLELKPITGRKHQLRKQLFSLGQPIYGDNKYKLSNSKKGLNKNLMLHSYQIRFMIKDIKYTYTALLPDYFKKLLNIKRLNFSNLK